MFKRKKGMGYGETHTLIVSLVVLHGALLALACPTEVMDIIVKQILLLIGLVALVALCPAGKPTLRI